MQQLILIRYGHHKEGTLTTEGKNAMKKVAEKLKAFLGTKVPLIIAADTPRAVESAKIIGLALGVGPIGIYTSMYAANEECLLPDCAAAAKIVAMLGEKHSIIVAVVSREYIESLPAYILKYVLGSEEDVRTSLNRGEALVIDYRNKKIMYLK